MDELFQLLINYDLNTIKIIMVSIFGYLYKQKFCNISVKFLKMFLYQLIFLEILKGVLFVL